MGRACNVLQLVSTTMNDVFVGTDVFAAKASRASHSTRRRGNMSCGGRMVENSEDTTRTALRELLILPLHASGNGVRTRVMGSSKVINDSLEDALNVIDVVKFHVTRSISRIHCGFGSIRVLLLLLLVSAITSACITQVEQLTTTRPVTCD